MALLKKIYRKDIVNQDVNVLGIYIDNEWKYQKESIPVAQYPNLASRAVVIGNGWSRREFDLTLFLPYRETTPWGDKTSWITKKQNKTFDTYGCNALYRDFKTDFTIATGETFINEISNSNYCNDNVVYTNSKYLEIYPNKFHLIPQNPEFNSGALAAYLAAFDGHKKVFMLGFDGIDSTNTYNVYAGTPNYPSADSAMNENYWVKSLVDVMNTYSDTEFIRVAPTATFRTPEPWKYCLNFKTISFRQFVIEADV